ncbi:hypothetical protein [Frigoriglobus tundricola]|uniref:Uncharacterized protein n=1 Tax=Frigoriglobus tundricola TaxID=2774151 RepID=A0A6M5YGJ0_9BACT|nr:hypothetical protein [Frigoriglobus tundricola]QJW93125.1 hypothetical protein FTUN_0628 [Frigoriglobus tundricola]
MTSRSYNPLACIPSPEIVRRKLHETEALAARLRILLDLAERLRAPLDSPTATSPTNAAPFAGQGVALNTSAQPDSR